VRTRRVVASIGVACALIGVTCAVAAPAAQLKCASPGWRAFGAGVSHSFTVGTGCSAINTTSAHTLVPAWAMHTPDSVSASPAIADGTAYVGSWDGTFYALDVATGAVKWTFRISSHARTAFGRIVSSATIDSYPDPATGRERQVVLFGGGSSLWALDTATGKELASIDLDPRTPALQRQQDNSDSPPVAEVESSPAVATIDGIRRIYVGIDVHNDAHVGRTGLIAVRLVPGAKSWRFEPLWKYDAETGSTYRGRAGLTVGSGDGWGCGGVWSSPAIDETTGVVTFGTASCSYAKQAYAAHENYAESMVALHANTGKLLWRFRPADALPTKDARIADADRDADFGASPNLFVLNGERVVGEGRKSADYYVRDELTGAPVSVCHVGQEGGLQSGFGIGGFLGTPAVETMPNGHVQVVGTTAIPIPHSAGDVPDSTVSLRGFDPATCRVNWTYRLAGPSYAHTSIVNGVAFVPDTTEFSVIAIDTSTGLPLWQGPVLGPPSGTAVVDGSTVVVGSGTRETDLEYKAFGHAIDPLQPASGIQAFRLPVG
jgi:polyvinyl alcohol dehydrogenase (cytochrome)